MSEPVVIQPPLENPAIKPSDEESLNLMKMAEEADRNNLGADLQPMEGVEAPAKEPETSADLEKEVQRDEQGRFTRTDGTKSEPDEKPVEKAPATTPEKPQSEFTKKQKEQERREKTWVQIEEEKRKVREEADRLHRERAEWEAQRQQTQSKPVPDRFSSDQYRKIASEFKAEAAAHKAAGNDAEAAESYSLATEALVAADSVAKQEAQEAGGRQMTEFQKTFAEHTNAFAKEVPDILNKDSELSRELTQLFDEEPMLNYHPDGARKGYEILQLRKAGAERDSLQKKVAELQAELNRYKGIVTIDGAPPNGQTSKKTFDQILSEDVDRAAGMLGNMAAAADDGR